MFRRLSRGKRLAVVVALVLAVGGVVAVAFAAPAKPPTPTITGFPANPTVTTGPASAHFTYSDTQLGVTFKCSLDGGAFTATGCLNTGFTTPLLAQGNHMFQVEAVSGSNTGSAASYSWAFVPPAPTIISGPTDPTGSMAAQFTFNDPTQPSVGFKCARDGGSFTTCTSGKTYTGLAGGYHTFQVVAQVGSNPPSAPATFSWTIDLTDPTIVVTFPADGGSYNNTGWLAGCPTAGICGTASDPAGIQAGSVGVAIRQLSSGKYWNGSSFSSSSIFFNTATGTTNWKLGVSPRPVDGRYTVFVKATDTVGNTTASNKYATATFTIDTVNPPAPVIVEKPTNPSNDKTPEFEFIDAKNQVTFTCKVDSGTPINCTGDGDNDGDPRGEKNNSNTSVFGEIQYGTLTPGPHCFSVFATDPAGNVGPTTQYCWTITGTTTGNIITVNSGSPQTATAGGTFALPLVAKVTNSSNTPLSGVSVTFTAPASGASGTFNAPCSGTTCTILTNASGLATATAFTANSTTGSYAVAAATAGASGPANFSLTNSTAMNFSISGSVTPRLKPGTSQPINLSITNPNASPLTIDPNGITITPSTTQSGCSSANFAVTHGPAVLITIPANSTKTLFDLGVVQGNWPVVTMLDTGTSQNNCQTAPLTLNFSGSGHGS